MNILFQTKISYLLKSYLHVPVLMLINIATDVSMC